MHYPLVVFSTAATVIASQAIISGAFSLTQQSIQLGFLPKMHLVHTASEEVGQIYLPVVNWLLAVATLGAVLAFGSSDALAGAYGIAVSALMAITTVLAALVAIQWGFPPVAVIAVNGLFFVIDLVFFSANAVKLLEGGWFPLLLALVVAFLMLTWRRGNHLLEDAARPRCASPSRSSWRPAASTPRACGCCACRHPRPTSRPAPRGCRCRCRTSCARTAPCRSACCSMSAVTTERPRVPLDKRARVVPIGQGIDRLILTYGFDEAPSVPEGVALALERGLLEDIDPGPHHLHRRPSETVIASRRRDGFARWRKKLFAFMARNSEHTAVYFGVPTAQAVELGLEIEL